MLFLHLRNGELHTVYNLLVLGLPQTPRAHQEPPDHQDRLGAVKTKSNKLLSLHLTYTQLALAQAHLLHLQRKDSSRLKHKLSTRSSLFCSKLFLFYSRVASGFQDVKKATEMNQGVPLYRVEEVT